MKFWLWILGFLFQSMISAQSVDTVSLKKVDSLIRVSRTFIRQGDFQKSLSVISEAENFAMERFGQESPGYGNCCLAHGAILYFMGDFNGAESWYLKARLIREKTVGRDHQDYSRVINNLAILYKNMGRYEQAENFYLEALDINGRTVGKDHQDYSHGLNNLAALYQKMGFFAKAESLFLESKLIREKIWGVNHPEYAASLSNLSLLYHDWGYLARAEQMALEAKLIREQTLGKEDPDYAESLNNLANLYADLGQFHKAESYYLEEEALYGKLVGQDHPDYAMCLLNLVALYQETNQYEKAMPLLHKARLIQEMALGKEHPDYTVCLGSLALLYQGRGLPDSAAAILHEALTILENTVGKNHPDYLSKQINLASVLIGKGQYDDAEKLLLEVNKVFNSGLLNLEQVNYLNCLDLLASLYSIQWKPERLTPLILESSQLNRKLFENATAHLSERELSEFVKSFSNRQGKILFYRHYFGDQIHSGICYDNVLFYKGFLLNSLNQVKRLALSDSSNSENYNLLKSYERRLAQEYSKPLAQRDSVQMTELEEKANTLQKDLVRRVNGYGDAKRQVNWQEVHSSLKTAEAAVEFVYYRCGYKQQTDSTLYAALVLKPGAPQPLFITLFEEKQLDSLLQTSGERKADYVNNLYSLGDRGAAIIEGPQRSLYELIWQPLEKELNGVQTIYFSPSGLLHRLNLGAIPISEEQTVADRYRLVELGSTRQLVIPTKVNPGLNDALLLGGIQYEMDSTLLAQAKPAETTGDLASRGGFSFTNSDSTLRGGNWNYLKWTDKEVTGLESILNVRGFQTTLRKGMDATEEEFKTIGQGKPSPRVLHLATHGFFFPDRTSSAKGRMTQDSAASEGTAKAALIKPQYIAGEEPVFKMSDHPMIRSGLILAGGNHAWKHGKSPREGMEDGILTAYEISQMNLSNTELIVLSACETGLGDIQGNEGVYGLQRAFKIAGAKYLVMSLWQVPDKQTSMLMTTFYKKWLEQKMNIPDAFHSAQKELRDMGFDPYQWAGFVLVE